MGDEDKKVEITAETRVIIKDTVEAVLEKVELGGMATPYEACFAEKSNSALSFGLGQHDIGVLEIVQYTQM